MESLSPPRTPPRRSRTLFTSTQPPTAEQAAQLAQGLTLAGCSLEAPQFHKTGWHYKQTFTAEDDPDRTGLRWEPPAFVLEGGKDPVKQREKTDVENLKLENGAFACIVRGVMDEEDCAALLTSINRKGFTPALLNIGGGMQKIVPEVRDGHRVIVDSPEFTEWLFRVLEPYLPAEHDGGVLVDLNERCRFLCYTPGQKFEPHFDGCYSRPGGHRNAGDTSKVTIQLYLHDVQLGAGGATNFLNSSDDVVASCQPAAGSVLLFSQDSCYHEGALVRSGLKYTLRTEVMYRTPSGFHLTDR